MGLNGRDMLIVLNVIHIRIPCIAHTDSKGNTLTPIKANMWYLTFQGSTIYVLFHQIPSLSSPQPNACNQVSARRAEPITTLRYPPNPQPRRWAPEVLALRGIESHRRCN